MTAQYDFFEEFEFEQGIDSPEMEILKLKKEMASLRKELEAIRKSSDNVRRGVFARLNEVSKLIIGISNA